MPSLPHVAVTSEVVPRHAASLIVLRCGAAGPEALMGLRGAGHRFMPNRLVFPGGAVDPEDADAAAAAELRPEVRRHLEIAADPMLARALAVAATREFAEETGLSLGAPPHLDGLDYLCRAVTPPDLPVRFNARFLVVEATRISGTLAGSGELEGLRWYGVAEALALDLAFVTRNVICRLQEWMELTPAERDGRARTPILGDRTWRLE
jgi:8-oxo-dGTP pyrophosphatase MutT (NUDIX family)